ncbi:hypothetical protein BCR41DRAFT_343479 [Lobosporangium transversale]|uniref:ER membrane protein complex subunit 1 n=1 Tax=Lobosporangium transversale TaxID=64571 RepID=A0A1Y2G5B5_9FUNG|nr:hypothetical protein BCR41DRAFT_343479 [Lobosporangium transversale]ORY95104.1 hypothetical protein BCR41DRAFT_343479 [Lobosporangium transversale]|eukprot:XP_021875313.1 hypothetical protein BCR41DRAFT_343479 [Lobosporangium transversale]
MTPSSYRGRHVVSWGLILWVFVLALVITPIFALDETQAGVIDWHHRWIGTPHLSAIPRTTRGSNTFFAATEKNVVAAIKAKTGELVWRQVLRDDEPVHEIRSISGHVLALTGTKEFHARLLDGKSGQVIWDFSPAGEGIVPGLAFGQAVTVTSEDSNLVILNQGTHVRKVSAKAGTELWHWKAEEGSATTFFSVLEAKGFDDHGDITYVLGLQRNVAAFTLEAVALDSATGSLIKTFNIKSNIDSFEDILTLGGGSVVKNGYVAWLEQDFLKVLTLGTNRVTQLSVKTILSEVSSFEELVGKLETVNLGLAEGNTKFIIGGTVGEYHDAKGSVLFDIDGDSGEIEMISDFGVRTGFSSYTAATKPGTSEVVILRAFREDEEHGAFELYDVSENKIILHQILPLPFDTYSHFSFVALELYSKGQGTQHRFYFSTLDGSFHAYSDVESERWQREEALASVKDVEFVDLPERKLWTQDVDEAGHTKAAKNLTIVERYVERLRNHIIQLKDLPAFIISYANPSSLFTKSPIAAPYSEVQINSLNKTIPPLYRDQFGLRKILVFSTEKGKVVAVDSGNKGQIVWSRYFPWGHDIKNIILIRHANVRLPPVIAIIADTSDGGGNKVMRTYRLNALTGKDFESDNFHFPAAAWIPAGYLSALKLPIEDPEQKTQVLALVDERMHITTYPGIEAAQEAFKALSDDFYFMLNNNIGDKVLKGYKAIVSSDMDRMDVEPIWSIPFPAGEEIAVLAERPSYEVMASLGRVLGDRGVLYKYQNPNYATVITVNKKPKHGTAPYLTVYLVDIAKGSILYQVTHDNVGLNQPILATQYENNVVYTFWSEGETSTSAKGYQAVALELYESQFRNQRTKSDIFSSFASERPHVIAQSFPFPHSATAIGVTSTKAGISAKDILFGLSRQSVMALNKRFLDPRRPTSALTAAEKEEMLIPYSALPDDPRLFLSYDLEIAGIKKIATSPTLLESTTIVVAYGQDVFVTRHAPSKTFDILNEDFSKSQLMLTIVVLAGVLFVTAPMMRNKILKEQWY